MHAPSRRLGHVLLITTLALTGCRSPAPASPETPSSEGVTTSPLGAGMVAGVDGPAVRALLVDHFEWRLRRAPVWATTLGDHRFDRELAVFTDETHEEDLATMKALLGRARELKARATPRDQLTLELLDDDLAADLGTRVCRSHLWHVSATDNPLAEYSRLPEDHEITSVADAEHLLARYRQIAARFADHRASLSRGAHAGLVDTKESITRAIAMFDRELAKPTAEWGLGRVLAALDRHGLPAAEVTRLRTEFTKVLEAEIVPAVRQTRALLQEELLPRARDAAHEGVGALPMGAECYAALARMHTSTTLTPDELHRIGLEEIARTDREIATLGEELFGKGTTLPDTLARLRGDKALYFGTREEILAAAGDALAAARAKLPEAFGRLPRTDCVVSEIPAYQAPYATTAYYMPPHAGSGKPGEFFVNTHEPTTRPRFEMRVLAVHESIPGHHLQIALGLEQAALPAFRRHLLLSAFVEGWALYTERLAADLGLYPTALDRMGMLSYDAWRAARLVVDTGLHAQGWTRAQAEAYMREHTALSFANISNEVDRYIAWPGQALAYKVGQRTIMALRERAEGALGARFDLKAFHDVVLGSGAVSLAVLERLVDAWIADRRAR